MRQLKNGQKTVSKNLTQIHMLIYKTNLKGVFQMIEEDMTDELIPKVLTHVDKEEIVNGTYTIPDYIQIIGNHAFKNQNKLEKIIISDSVTEIGKYAFEDCQNLREVIMSKNIKKIGENAFEVKLQKYK